MYFISTSQHMESDTAIYSKQSFPAFLLVLNPIVTARNQVLNSCKAQVLTSETKYFTGLRLFSKWYFTQSIFLDLFQNNGIRIKALSSESHCIFKLFIHFSAIPLHFHGAPKGHLEKLGSTTSLGMP